MNIEKTIKKQALAYLSRDNWSTAIGGFFIICLPAILILLFTVLLFSTLGLFIDFDNPTLAQEGIIAVLEFALIIPFLISTPMITGYLRMCYNISKGRKAGLRDVFYYYGNGQFGKCFHINLKIILRLLLHFVLVTLPSLFISTVYAVTGNKILFITAIFLLIAATIETLFYSVKYSVIPVVMVEDESLSAAEIFYLGTSFIKNKTGTAKMLLFTFFPYFLLCFFVVPWIFVFPYLCVSFMTNSKWISDLYILDKNEKSTISVPTQSKVQNA